MLTTTQRSRLKTLLAGSGCLPQKSSGPGFPRHLTALVPGHCRLMLPARHGVSVPDRHLQKAAEHDEIHEGVIPEAPAYTDNGAYVRLLDAL